MRRAYKNREKAEKFAARQKRSLFVRSTKVEQTGRRLLTNYLVLRHTLRVSHPPILLGTSSFTATGWEGMFYPKGMRSSDYLVAPCVEWLQIFPLMVFNSIQKHSLRALERREALRSLTAEDMKKCV